MKKITVNLVKNELIDAGAASTGVVGGSMLMKLAADYVPGWLAPLAAIGIGFGARLLSDNSTVKDIGTGVMIAGVIDGTKKVLGKFAPNVPMLAQVNNAIPSLSGPGGEQVYYGFVPQQLRGDFTDAQVVDAQYALR